MLYNIFNTEAEALTAEALDWAKYKSDLPTSKTIQDENGEDVIVQIDNSQYLAITQKWAEPVQRLDGKWIFPKYSGSDQSYTEETYSSGWFESEGE